MIKIECDKPILDLRQKPILDETEQPVTIGQGIANILISNPTGGKMKMLILSEKFYTDTFVEVDDADFALIKKSIEDTTLFQGNNLIPGRLLIYLESLKDNK